MDHCTAHLLQAGLEFGCGFCEIMDNKGIKRLPASLSTLGFLIESSSLFLISSSTHFS
jgi:hypothetical protein